LRKRQKTPQVILLHGIYIFNYEILKEFLKEDHQDKRSEHDFGRTSFQKCWKPIEIYLHTDLMDIGGM
jgi:ADP-glucose pyrophosphorylase